MEAFDYVKSYGCVFGGLQQASWPPNLYKLLQTTSVQSAVLLTSLIVVIRLFFPVLKRKQLNFRAKRANYKYIVEPKHKLDCLLLIIFVNGAAYLTF